jgi:biopolymer transport protein ExbD
MSEINVPNKTGKRKVQAPRIDLTPMVDLGFLLITFFMFTTTMVKPKAMEINMPNTVPTNEVTVFTEESTISLILVNGHKVVYYSGTLEAEEQLKGCPIDNVRDVLIKKKKDAGDLPNTFSAEAHKLHVLIKPNDDSKFDDLVKLLDEMTIVNVPYYAIVDVTLQEKEWIGKKH